MSTQKLTGLAAILHGFARALTIPAHERAGINAELAANPALNAAYEGLKDSLLQTFAHAVAGSNDSLASALLVVEASNALHQALPSIPSTDPAPAPAAAPTLAQQANAAAAHADMSGEFVPQAIVTAPSVPASPEPAPPGE